MREPERIVLGVFCQVCRRWPCECPPEQTVEETEEQAAEEEDA